MRQMAYEERHKKLRKSFRLPKFALTFHAIVPHHASILVFEIVAVIEESPSETIEADERLNFFTWHDQHGILPAIVYKAAA